LAVASEARRASKTRIAFRVPREGTPSRAAISRIDSPLFSPPTIRRSRSALASRGATGQWWRG
jgi:hypothetical protein